MHLIMTRSGLAFDVMCPEPMAIQLDDIAESMALQFIAPGHTSRPVSLAEYALLLQDVMRQDLGVTDPAGHLVALLVEAHRAYMPLLDREHVDLWGPKLTGIYTSMRKALCSRFGVHAATAAYARQLSVACTRVQATMLRDLSAHSSSLFQAARGATCPEWLNLSLATPTTADLVASYRTAFSEALQARQAAIEATPVTSAPQPQAAMH